METITRRSYSKYGIGFTAFAALGWIIIGLDVISKWTGLPINEQSGDLLNWAALTVEVGLAIIITGVVFFVSKKQQDQIQDMLENQQEFLKEQKDFQEKRKIFSINVVRSYLLQLRSVVEEYDVAKSATISIIPDAKSLLGYYESIIKQNLKTLTFQLTFSSDVLEPHYVETIRNVLEITDQYVTDKPQHNARGHGIIGNIDSILEELPNLPA